MGATLVGACRLLTAVASLGAWALGHGDFSSCGHVLSCPERCDLPGPGIEHLSPALSGRFLTTGPPGKS